MEQVEEQRLQQFLSLYNGHYRQLYFFAKTLVPTEGHAEDVLQEASLAMWKKFVHFKKDTNFLAWACQIIRIEVAYWYRKKKRERIFFEEELVNVIAERWIQREWENTSSQQDALLECVKKLTPRLKKLLQDRYFNNMKPDKIAEQSRQRLDAVYQQLCRLRRFLRVCIVEKLNAEPK